MRRAASRSSAVQWPTRPWRAASSCVQVFNAPLPASIDPLYSGVRDGEKRGHTRHCLRKRCMASEMKPEPLSDFSTKGAP